MKNVLYLLLFTLLFACGKPQKKEPKTAYKTKPLLSVVQKHQKTVSVKTIFKKEIIDWKSYQNLNEFIKQFSNNTPNESLSNALELKDLVKNLRDSVKPAILETPAFKARIHVLYNESLRLTDMTKIPAINADAVNKQVDKILVAFTSVNKKINTVFSQKTFEELITIDDAYIGLDTTKIDSVSRKNILIEREILENDIRGNQKKPKKITAKNLFLNKKKKFLLEKKKKLLLQSKKKINLKKTQQ